MPEMANVKFIRIQIQEWAERKKLRNRVWTAKLWSQSRPNILSKCNCMPWQTVLGQVPCFVCSALALRLLQMLLSLQPGCQNTDLLRLRFSRRAYSCVFLQDAQNRNEPLHLRRGLEESQNEANATVVIRRDVRQDAQQDVLDDLAGEICQDRWHLQAVGFLEAGTQCLLDWLGSRPNRSPSRSRVRHCQTNFYPLRDDFFIWNTIIMSVLQCKSQVEV
mmetsp:Transcript_50999/g.89688  ORF Transcript_50999/g.89688 Transcript_50999/m.89688 type:complete len:219 (+) Transcript_50999:2169-2825(+)